jgi:hypothetical protein
MMDLSNMSSRHIVKTAVGRRMREIEFWLREANLEIVQDYDYLGRERARDVFAFESKQTAILFKLTFGSE